MNNMNIVDLSAALSVIGACCVLAIFALYFLASAPLSPHSIALAFLVLAAFGALYLLPEPEPYQAKHAPIAAAGVAGNELPAGAQADARPIYR